MSLRREVLRDERLVLEVAHREVERPLPVAAGDLGEPVRGPPSVGFSQMRRRSENIAKPSAYGLMPLYQFESNDGWHDDVGVALEELEHEAVVDQPPLVQAVEERVVPEGGPALVHHLGLRLRVEVLRELAHDAHELPLPRLEARRELLDEVEDVLLRLARERLAVVGDRLLRRASGSVRHRSLNCRSRWLSRSFSRAASALSVSGAGRR